MANHPTAVVMLAAGVGSRFGGGKLDADLGGKPLGHWAAETAEAVGFAKRIIVTPPTPPSFCSQLVGWERVINTNINSGMASSIRAAVLCAAGYSRMVIMLADMPLIEVDHLIRLADGDRVAFTLYADSSNGVPAAFPAEVYGVLASLSDGLSPATLKWDIGIDAIEPKSSNSLMDVDTVADLALARSIVSKRRRCE
jgi:molybdenum cofactor cytidylyltransferase